MPRKLIGDRGLGLDRGKEKRNHQLGLPIEIERAPKKLSHEPEYIEATATFSPDEIYRYSLVRRWAEGLVVLWIMLNPSTADATQLDPTLGRVLGFTQAWAYGYPDLVAPANAPRENRFAGFEVCNAYGLRSTDPKRLRQVSDPVGPGNDEAIRRAVARAAIIVVGWGGGCKSSREREIYDLIRAAGRAPLCLRAIKSGAPEHPLYVPGGTVPGLWAPRG